MPTLSLPYWYWVTYASAKGHRWNDIDSARAEFKVPDVEPADAPLITEQHEAGCGGVVHRYATRLYDGRLYESVLDTESATAVSPEDFSQLFRHAPASPHFGPHPQRIFSFERHFPNLPVRKCFIDTDPLYEPQHRDKRWPPRRWKKSVVSECRDRALRSARTTYNESIIVIDGTVWTAVRPCEPMWHVEHPEEGGPVDVHLSASLPDCLAVAFRAHRRADALAFAHELAARKNTTVEVQPHYLIIHAPRLLQLDEGELLCRSLLSAMVFKEDGNVDCVEAFGRHEPWTPGMKQAAQRLKKLSVYADMYLFYLEAIVEAIEAFMEACPRPLPAQWPKAHRFIELLELPLSYHKAHGKELIRPLWKAPARPTDEPDWA